MASLYREIERKTIHNFNLRCIDGSLHGCGKCVGYCSYDGHPGFLTSEIQKVHQCLEKGCNYYDPKPAAQSRPRDDHRTLQKKILLIAQAATASMEGLRVLRVALGPDNCVVYYAAIAQYDVSSIEDEISASAAYQIQMKQIPCDFNVAAALVMA